VSRSFGNAIRPVPRLIDAIRNSPLDKSGFAGIDAVAPPFRGVTDGGEKEQVEAAGNPEHDSDTDLLNAPPEGVGALSASVRPSINKLLGEQFQSEAIGMDKLIRLCLHSFASS